MNTFERHMSLMAKHLRDFNRNGGLHATLESDDPNNAGNDINRDIEVLADALDPEIQHSNTTSIYPDWVDDDIGDGGVVSTQLQAALDEYNIEDDIQVLEHINECNDVKLEQLQEVKAIIAGNWEDGVTANDIAKLNIAEESILMAYKGKRLPLAAAMEAIDVKAAGLAAAGLAAVIAIIWKLYTLIRARFGKGANSDAAKKVADENIKDGNDLISDTFGSSAYDPNKFVKVDDIENIFDESDAGTKPQTFLTRYDGMEAVKLKDFVNDYLNDVILSGTTNSINMALRDPSRMGTYVAKLTEFGNHLPKALEVATAIADSYNAAHNGGKLDTTVLTKYEGVLKEIAKNTSELTKIKAAIDGYSGSKAKLRHDEFVKAVNSFGKIAKLPEETSDKLDDFGKEVAEIKEKRNPTKLTEGHLRDNAKKMLDEIIAISQYFTNYMLVVNTVAGARLTMSRNYKSYAKVLSKAYQVTSDKN